MARISRREFLGHSALGGAALALPASSWARVLGANDDLRVACIGIRSRGRALLNNFRRQPGVRIAALCDVDRDILAARAAELEKTGQKAATYVDVRELLANKDIDAVVIATPNHWHSTIAIWALDAGKDVYVEKPVSHNVHEGRLLVERAAKLGRIVQAGTQSRSNPGLIEAVKWVRAGNLGKIELARGLCYKPRMSIGKVAGPQKVPEQIDYELWIGPSPMVPLRRKNLHYDWHWDFNTGNGDLGNQGIHQMDIARWVLGEKNLSPRVLSAGGRLGYDDDGNTPNTQIVIHDYPAAPLIFEVRGLPRSREFQANAKAWRGNMPTYRSTRIGVIVQCEGGLLEIPSYASAMAFDSAGKKIRSFKGSADHQANFIAAVRSRRAQDLNAPILEGHISSALCHTANISYLLGERRSAAEIRAALGDAAPAAEAFGRMAEHLSANGVHIEKPCIALGPWLEMNPRAERFVQKEANILLARRNRAPYEIS